jgi:hypothetical protein
VLGAKLLENGMHTDSLVGDGTLGGPIPRIGGRPADSFIRCKGNAY